MADVPRRRRRSSSTGSSESAPPSLSRCPIGSCVRPVSLRHRLVDDDDAGGASVASACVKSRPLDDRDPQRVEVAGTGQPVRGARRLRSRSPARTAFDREAAAGVRAAQRQVADRAATARRPAARRQLALEVLAERRPLRRAVEVLLRQCDVHHEHVARRRAGSTRESRPTLLIIRPARRARSTRERDLDADERAAQHREPRRAAAVTGGLERCARPRPRQARASARG